MEAEGPGAEMLYIYKEDHAALLSQQISNPDHHAPNFPRSCFRICRETNKWLKLV